VQLALHRSIDESPGWDVASVSGGALRQVQLSFDLPKQAGRSSAGRYPLNRLSVEVGEE